MTIQRIAQRLNEKAIDEGFEIASLPVLRKKFLHKKILPESIFTKKTIIDGEDVYAFHYGGRDEIQFNVGRELLNNKYVTRYGLAFSLESSPSLYFPLEVLEPFRKRFNQCIDIYPDFFNGFEMWYSNKNERNGNYKPQKISDKWFQYRNFIFIGKIIHKTLDKIDESDLETILQGFDDLLPVYRYCVLQDPAVINNGNKIFTRLTSNENNWEIPSPHKWKEKYQGNKHIPFENQYGFGHEEWLFNPRYNVNGFQYGHIVGIHKGKSDITKYIEAHFYTVKKEISQAAVYYLGYIKNLSVIKNDLDEQNLINDIIRAHWPDMLAEVESINADIKGLTENPYITNVKFKLEDVIFFDDPVYQPDFDLYTYKRFQPYQIKGSLNDLFKLKDEEDISVFPAGKASQTSQYNRENRKSSITVTKVHDEITEALELFLKPEISLSKKNISVNKMRFRGNIADLVTINSDQSINIYEVKTSSSGRRNIRDAIGQLLDYALHSFKFKVNRLIIVSPVSLNEKEIDFLDELKKKISFPIDYYGYNKDESERFTKQ